MDTKGLLGWVLQQEDRGRSGVIHGFDDTRAVVRILVYVGLQHMQMGHLVRWNDHCLQMSRAERLTSTLVVVQDSLIDLWQSIIPSGQACIITDVSKYKPARTSLCLLPLSVYRDALEAVYAGYPVPQLFSSYVWLRVVVHTLDAKGVIAVVFIEAQYRWVVAERTISTQTSLLAALLWLHTSDAHRCLHAIDKRHRCIEKYCYPPSVSAVNEIQPYENKRLAEPSQKWARPFAPLAKW
jgi:hypothetical protein